MDIEAGVEGTVDELGVGLFVVLLTPLICCLLPVRYQWKNLSEREQLKIVVCVSILVGNVDYVLDITVAKNWFEEGDVWWGSLICVSIFVSGLVSWYFRACHCDKGELCDAVFDSFNPDSRDWKVLPLFLLGFGSIYDAIVVVCSGFEDGRTYEFQTTRLMEIMIESLPSGALQIYDVCVLRNDWHKWLETASIIASLLSVSWGLMTSVSRSLYIGKYMQTFAPKWSILCFCLSDFIANTLPLAMFISLHNIRSFSMYILFPTLLLLGVLRRRVENEGLDIFDEGLVDGMVWIVLSIISSARLVISPSDEQTWNTFTSVNQQSMFLRFIVNLVFFLIAVILDISNGNETFSAYFSYYIGLFALANLTLLVSIVKLTGSLERIKL